MYSVSLHTGLHHHPARGEAESEGSDSRPYLGGVDGASPSMTNGGHPKSLGARFSIWLVLWWCLKRLFTRIR